MKLLADILREMSPIELVAALLGLVNVTLVARRSVWNYPFGLVMVALYGWVFFRQKLYSDALLQIFFFVVQIYGWWYWVRGRAETGDVRVELLSWRQRGEWFVGCAVATVVWGWLMHHTDAAYPWWDASVAVMSVAAQILMSRRYLENWWLWIAVDLDTIPLYATKNLWVTSGLYVIFLAISVWGLIGWANNWRAQRR